MSEPLLREHRLTTGRVIRISLSPTDGGYLATDASTYDGAPDAGRMARIIGFARTEDEAAADLIEQHEELA